MRRLFAFMLALLLPAGAAVGAPHPTQRAFPAGFVWGTATAAVQVEGGTVHSDWERFERRPGAIRDGALIGDAARHYELYEQDFRAAAAMHTNGYRCSLEWSRLAPTRGAWDLAAVQHYRAMLVSLRRKGIRPLVTLHHFSNPQWVADQGGWENPATIDDFDAFVARCATSFGDLVDDWVTFNEPTIYAAEGYVDGVFPPGRHGDLAAMTRVLGNIAKAHGRAYHTLYALDRTALAPGAACVRVGIAEHMIAFSPAWRWNPLDGLLAGMTAEATNFKMLDAATSGQLRIDLVLSHDWEEVPWLANTLDFVGVNYYTHSYASMLRPFQRLFDPHGNKTDLGLDIYPDGMFDVLNAAYRRYHKPIFITETGVADEKRRLTPCFMVQHLERVGQALAAGIPVMGLYWWSLLDNFEWQNGYHGRFGLLAVDFTQPSRPRTWTPAAGLYARIARQNGLDPELVAHYGTGYAIEAPSPAEARDQALAR